MQRCAQFKINRCYNMKRVMRILGVGGLMEAIRT